MKKLSSDIFFFQGLIGLIIGPVAIFFFIKFIFVQAFPLFVIPFFYLILGFIVIRGWYNVFRSKQILFDDQYIYLKNYFSKEIIQIPLNNIINITPSFNLNSRNSFRKPYRLTYDKDGKKNSYKFYRSLELNNINNLESLVGLQKYKSVITNTGVAHDSDAIIAASLKIDRNTRLTAAMMDLMIMTIITMIFALPYMIPLMVKNQLPYPKGILFYLMNSGFALFFCKDCIYGQSIAKRILKQQIVNNQTGQIASPLQCFLRDIFIIIWPVEVVAILIKPERRLGDIVAGTKVITFNPGLEKQKPNYLQLGLCFILSYAIMLAVSTLSSPR